MGREHELQLLERIQRGDTRAFGQLVAPYQRRLITQITRIVKNDSDADDVMQEALIRSYRGLRDFRGDACLYTWLYRIATNCALALLSRQKRQGADFFCSDTEVLDSGREATSGDDPEQLIVGKQMAETVGAVLSSMRPEFRTAIVLREFEGFSYDEIASAMQCPVGTVKSRISSARIAIVNKLSTDGFALPG